jgi:urease accessory protein
MGLLDLLQLADASFPSGGFAFSNGLESLAKLGYVKTLAEFRQYLECHLGQLASAEMPFLASAYAAAAPPGATTAPEGAAAVPGSAAMAGSLPATAAETAGPRGPFPQAESIRAPNEPETFAQVSREWDAWVFLPAPRRASLSQGQAWTRALEAAYAAPGVMAPGVMAIRPWFAERGIPLHFLTAFAAGLRACGFPFAEAQSLLLHMALRDQLGAAVRLGLIGSLQAQRLHREQIAGGEALLAARAGRIAAGHAAAERAAPMIDLGQASHPYLYSKLFQS